MFSFRVSSSHACRALWDASILRLFRRTVGSLFFDKTCKGLSQHAVTIRLFFVQNRYKWNLHELDISGHKIGDAGAGHLAKLLYRNESMQKTLVFLSLKDAVRRLAHKLACSSHVPHFICVNCIGPHVRWMQTGAA